MATATATLKPRVNPGHASAFSPLSSLGALRKVPILGNAFGGLLHAQKIVEPLFATLNPSAALQSQVRDQLIAAVLPRMQATAGATSATSDVLDAAKHGLIEGIKAAWQEALAAGVAALPAGPQQAAGTFLKILVLRGAQPAWDAFRKKYDELKNKPAQPPPTVDSPVMEVPLGGPPGVAITASRMASADSAHIPGGNAFDQLWIGEHPGTSESA